MIYIDSAILDLTERLCRWFQRLTGRTNVWLAVQLTNLSIVVYFVWASAYILGTELPLGIGLGLGLFCAVLLYVLTQTILREPVEVYERSAYQRVAKGLRNPRRLRDALLRFLFLTLAVVMLPAVLFVYTYLHLSIILLGYSLIVLTTILLYVIACDPLPPCMGTVFEWLKGLAPAGEPAEERSAASNRESSAR